MKTEASFELPPAFLELKNSLKFRLEVSWSTLWNSLEPYRMVTVARGASQ